MITPVLFYFYGNGEYIALPINPGEFKIERKNLNTEKNVLQNGQVNILQEPGLRSLKISSYFPRRESLIYGPINIYNVIKTAALLNKKRKDPEDYVEFFTAIEKNKLPLKLVVTDLKFSMLMAVDKFTFIRRAGEHKDIYFELNLKEWVRYSPLKVVVEKDAKGNVTNVTKTEISNNDKELGIIEVPATYTPSIGETIWEVARRLTGDGTNYKAILGVNNSSIPSGLENLAGKVLRIPNEVR